MVDMILLRNSIQISMIRMEIFKWTHSNKKDFYEYGAGIIDLFMMRTPMLQIKERFDKDLIYEN